MIEDQRYARLAFEMAEPGEARTRLRLAVDR
jgi:hypothetical protein